MARNTYRNKLGLNGLTGMNGIEYAGYTDEQTPCFNLQNDNGHLNTPVHSNGKPTNATITSPLTPTSPLKPLQNLRMPQ